MDHLGDDVDIATMLEERARERAIREILEDIPKNRDIESLLDVDLECSLCGDLIPLERQRIVLSIAKECDMCIECQADTEFRYRLYR